VNNWAGNVTYSTERILRPRSVAEAQEMVADAELLRPLGTRHSFSRVADSAGALLSTEHLNRIVEIGGETVTVEAGSRYGDLTSALHEHGLALQNVASLPHISVGGAIATGTHGSGVRNPSLAAGVAALELVCADGSISRLRRGDAEFDGAVVSLGSLGLVTRVSLDVVPAFDLRQYVFEELPWSAVDTGLDAILAGGYSVSLFTTWAEPAIGQVWVKTKERLDRDSSYFGAAPATQPRSPVPGADWQSSTEQLGVPGASFTRLPHFRLEFTPSSGAELQSEYVVPREHGADAVRELRRLAGVVSPLLLISEIRTVTADTLWLSPFYEQDSVAFHFTWQPRSAEVLAVLPRIEAALAPFRPRPHWGKLFTVPAQALEGVYPRLPDFRRLMERFDGGGKFRNDFIARHVSGGTSRDRRAGTGRA
jgi:xylitol oxidase